MSAKIEILSYIRNQHYGGKDWIAAGTIEDWGYQSGIGKGSTCDRRLEEMCKDGILEVNYDTGFKRYRLKEMFAHLKK